MPAGTIARAITGAVSGLSVNAAESLMVCVHSVSVELCSSYKSRIYHVYIGLTRRGRRATLGPRNGGLPVEFGITLFPDVGPAEKSPADYFRESFAIVEHAEQLGYTHVRSIEHHFTGYGGY